MCFVKYTNLSPEITKHTKGVRINKMKNNIVHTGLLLFLFSFTACNSSKSLSYQNIETESKCELKKGYWYNNKCWKEFEDEGILNSDIDSVVEAQMKIIKNSIFTIDNKVHPLIAFMPIEEKEGLLFITVYGTKDNYKTLIFPTGKKKIKKGSFKSPTMLFDGNALSGNIVKESKLTGTAIINIIDLENLNLEINGEIIAEDNASKSFSFKPNEAISGAGTSHLEIKGGEAYLSGDLGTISYWQLKNLIKNHPEVKTIVMTQISGSINDAVNMHTGRILREAGLNTKVLSDSEIASGGVDLFCAGVERIVEEGAKVGIHSWCCVDDLTAIEVPRDHPAHKDQIAYFSMCLGDTLGTDFYFNTLDAAPFDNVHWMTIDEIKKWNVATKIIKE